MTNKQMPFVLSDLVAKANEAYFAARGIAIPASIAKATERDTDPPEPSHAQRLIGREICQETRRYDERECVRAYNRGSDDAA